MFLLYSDGYYGAVAAIVGLVYTIRVPYKQPSTQLILSVVTFFFLCNFGGLINPEIAKTDRTAS